MGTHKKIDIFVKKNGVFEYVCSTCYYKTLTEAKNKYSEKSGLQMSDIKCAYDKGNNND